VGAAKDQGDISNFVQTTKWVGTVPACPTDCGGTSFEDPNIGGGSGSGGKGCAFSVDGRDDSGIAAGLFLALGLIVARRRRKQA
jgi:MYXO-CTERM domain-containing protein